MKYKVKRVVVILLTFFLLSGCVNQVDQKKLGSVYYEIFVASFNDSNNDGIGDLKGLENKLDYLDDLGVSGIWLMPINPSNTYHKYDVIDYMAIDESYGSMEDFERLVSSANEKNIDIILDLVLNHTSSEHPWFVEAKKAIRDNTYENADSYYNYYNFIDERTGKYYAVPGSSKYYEAVFWDQMPDLNLDNPKVRAEIAKIVEFWMNKGIKGFRLDAILHLYNNNTTKNVEFLTWFSELVRSYDADAYIVGEAWTSPEIVSRYYEADISNFNFALSQADGKIVSTIRSQKGKTLSEFVDTYQTKIKAINANSIDSVFLSNHDQGRSAAFFATDEKAMRLMASTYLLMPGIPFIYYGEELGMLGSGKDENKRLAFIWDSENESAQCLSPKDNDYATQIKQGLKQQQKEKSSLFNHYKKVLDIRNKHTAFTNGTVENVSTHDALYMMKHQDANEVLLVIHNFSKEEVAIEIEELFSKVSDSITYDDMKVSFKDNILKIPAYSSVIME